jgi:hypothetical protein
MVSLISFIAAFSVAPNAPGFKGVGKISFNGNFKILKRRYCTVPYKTIFCGDIALHRGLI